MRKKLKQKAEGVLVLVLVMVQRLNAADGGSDGGSTSAAAARSAAAAVPAAPQTASTATAMTQQQLENIAASHTFNEAIQSGSPFKVATKRQRRQHVSTRT